MSNAERVLTHLLAVLFKIGILYSIWNLYAVPRFGFPQARIEDVFLVSWFVMLMITPIKIQEKE